MNFQSMLFQDWTGVARTMLVGCLAYVTLIVFLRIAGKRALSQLNAFDFVVTVALGSTLSSILLQRSVSLADGAAALGLLICLQYAVTFSSVRSTRISKLVRSEPALLFRHGDYCESTMKRERITRDEVLSAIRSNGGYRIDDADSVVLEGNGSISVALRREERHRASDPA